MLDPEIFIDKIDDSDEGSAADPYSARDSQKKPQPSISVTQLDSESASGSVIDKRSQGSFS